MLFARKSTCQPGARALKRRAAAVVELAVCLPMIALIVLATIECANMLFLRQTLVQASYEAVKVAVHRKGTNDTAIAAALRVTDGRQIKRVTVDFDPSDVQKVERGEVIRATVSARSSENSFFDVPPFQNQVLIGTAVMVKE